MLSVKYAGLVDSMFNWLAHGAGRLIFIREDQRKTTPQRSKRRGDTPTSIHAISHEAMQDDADNDCLRCSEDGLLGGHDRQPSDAAAHCSHLAA